MWTYRLLSIGALLLMLGTAIAPATAGDRSVCESTGLAGTEDDFGELPDFTGFGRAVAISGDNAAVGIPFRSVGGSLGPRGRVAVYACDARTRTWSRTGSVDPQGQGEFEAEFGSELALQADRLVVGSTNAVHLFEKRRASKKSESSGWNLLFKLQANGVDKFIAPIFAYDHPYLAVTVTKVMNEEPVRFVDIYRVGKGNRPYRVDRLHPPEDFAVLGLDDRTLVAGAQVYTKRKDGRWRLQQTLQAMPSDDSFGVADLAIRGDTILVGSPREEGTLNNEGSFGGGAVYVFQLEKGVWEQTQRIRPTINPHGFSGFGQTLAFDGDYAAIGAPFPYDAFQRDYGPTFLYRMSGERLVFDRMFENAIATSIDLSGQQLMIGTNVSVIDLPFAHGRIERLGRPANKD